MVRRISRDRIRKPSSITRFRCVISRNRDSNSRFKSLIPGSIQGPHERLLLNQLLSNYNTLERPVSNESEPLQVRFGLTLQQIIDVVSIDFPLRSLSHSRKSQSAPGTPSTNNNECARFFLSSLFLNARNRAFSKSKFNFLLALLLSWDPEE